jgi:bifunctional non-homologous end joining protein LigD
MLPSNHGFPFSKPDWIFEPKWDGYRALCLVENGSIKFTSRRHSDLTKRFPELQNIRHSIGAHSGVFDGEIVALDDNGMPRFEYLQNRKKCFRAYFVFDCLVLNGNDLRSEPLLERKKALKRSLAKSANPYLKLTEYVVTEGEQLFLATENLGLEGIVAKKSDSLYVGGRTKNWLKIKTMASKAEMKKRVETWGR